MFKIYAYQYYIIVSLFLLEIFGAGKIVKRAGTHAWHVLCPKFNLWNSRGPLYITGCVDLVFLSHQRTHYWTIYLAQALKPTLAEYFR